jgi:hypothetical protein
LLQKNVKLQKSRKLLELQNPREVWSFEDTLCSKTQERNGASRIYGAPVKCGSGETATWSEGQAGMTTSTRNLPPSADTNMALARGRSSL